MMEKINIIDLQFQNTRKTIAAFLVSDHGKNVLVETGPESTWPALEKGLASYGLQPDDLDGVLLTHIHFDHAGAAWKLAERGVKIHLHPVGVPHMARPERLWQSAAKIYGDQMEPLWGIMKPIKEDYLVPVEDLEILNFGQLKFKAIHSPGHAIHHVSWKYESSLFSGDVGGVKIDAGPVVPPCPPPDINLEDWKISVEKIRNENPKQIFLTHFGEIRDVERHLSSLIPILEDWANWIKKRYQAGTEPKDAVNEFMAYTTEQLKSQGADSMLIDKYQLANPSWMSVAGLYRYWKQKEKGLI